MRTFTLPAEILTFLPGFAVLVASVLEIRTSRAHKRLSPPSDRTPVRGRGRRALPWLFLVLAFTGWELLQLFGKPRSTHPTISSLTDSLLSTHVTRAIGFAVWLAVGWLLVRGRERHE